MTTLNGTAIIEPSWDEPLTASNALGWLLGYIAGSGPEGRDLLLDARHAAIGSESGLSDDSALLLAAAIDGAFIGVVVRP